VPWKFVDCADNLKRKTVFKILIVILIVIEYLYIRLVIFIAFAVIGIIRALHIC
jgi:hypothetical protein